jgi:hypothetical protein
MFRVLMVFPFSLLLTQVDAQLGLINRTTTRQDSAFLFIADDNNLQITGFTSSNWKLTAKRASIETSDSPWLFRVISDQSGPDTLQLYRNGKLVLTKIFYVIEGANIICRLGAITDSTATIEQIIANRRLRAFSPGNADFRCIVIDFEIHLIAAQLPDWKKMLKIQGTNLTSDANDRIRQLRPGDKITFASARIKCSGCRTRELPPFTLTIKKQ